MPRVGNKHRFSIRPIDLGDNRPATSEAKQRKALLDDAAKWASSAGKRKAAELVAKLRAEGREPIAAAHERVADWMGNLHDEISGFKAESHEVEIARIAFRAGMASADFVAYALTNTGRPATKRQRILAALEKMAATTGVPTGKIIPPTILEIDPGMKIATWQWWRSGWKKNQGNTSPKRRR